MINTIKSLSIFYLFLVVAAEMPLFAQEIMGEKEIQHKIRQSYQASADQDFNALLTYASKGICFTLSDQTLSQERKNEFIAELLSIFVHSLLSNVRETENSIAKAFTVDEKTKKLMHFVYTLIENLDKALDEAIKPSLAKEMSVEQLASMKKFLSDEQSIIIDQLLTAKGKEYTIKQLASEIALAESYFELVSKMMVRSYKHNNLQDFIDYLKEYNDVINIIINEITIETINLGRISIGSTLGNIFAKESNEKLKQTKKYLSYFNDIISTLEQQQCSTGTEKADEKTIAEAAPTTETPIQQLQKAINSCLTN